MTACDKNGVRLLRLEIYIIDLEEACVDSTEHYGFVGSNQYRAPEVTLGGCREICTATHLAIFIAMNRAWLGPEGGLVRSWMRDCGVVQRRASFSCDGD